MNQYVTGFILGLIILLPGMSGGTVLLIFGLYEQLMKDLSKLKIKPYLPLGLGVMIGIFVGGKLFAFFVENHRDPTMALLLGCLLASIRPILKRTPKLNTKFLIYLLVGALIGCFSVRESAGVEVYKDIDGIVLFIAGALSSAAMIIPGVPGSSVLILMDLYEEIILYVSDLNLLKLMYFGLGSLVGMIFLVKLLSKLYESRQNELSFLFSGIIIGSSRALIPHAFSWTALLIFAIGFGLTWKFSDRL